MVEKVDPIIVPRESSSFRYHADLWRHREEIGGYVKVKRKPRIAKNCEECGLGVSEGIAPTGAGWLRYRLH